MPRLSPERERVVDAVLRRERARHRDAEHRSRAERLHREMRGHRRVDAAREADHRAGRQVLLAEVVADAEHERGLELRDAAPDRDASSGAPARLEIDHLEAPARRAAARRGRGPCASTANEPPSKISSSLPPTWFTKRDRHAVPRARAPRPCARRSRRLADVERRGRAGSAPAPRPRARARRPGRARSRCASTQASSQTVSPSAGRPPAAGDRCAVLGRHEVALLVEHVVGRAAASWPARAARARRAAARPRSASALRAALLDRQHGADRDRDPARRGGEPSSSRSWSRTKPSRSSRSSGG